MNNENWIEAAGQAVMNTYSRFPVVLEKGEGVYVYDAAGKKYLDFVAGIAVNCLGHGHKGLTEAISAQAKEMIHVSNLYWTKPQMRLAKRLTDNSCFDKAFFCNSGAEAVEGALKMARKYAHKKNSGRYEIIAMENSFHGRTYGAVSATGQYKYQKELDPLLPGILHVPFNDIDALKNAVSTKTCAIMLEPIQGEGGVNPAKVEYLKTISELCAKEDILLIFDEVQCGAGRTGKLFAYDVFGVEPDIVAMAKGLAGGVPIGALLAKEAAAAAFAPGDHASTFGGNPLACAAANAVLDELLENDLLEHVQDVGKHLRQRLLNMQKKISVIEDVRGVGLLQGIQLTAEASAVVKKCMEAGLMILNAGTHVIRFVPPLIIQKEQIDEGLGILENVLESI